MLGEEGGGWGDEVAEEGVEDRENEAYRQFSMLYVVQGQHSDNVAA